MANAASILQQGIDAIRDGHYGDGIELLEGWCDRAGPKAEQYPKVVRILVQAYQRDGRDEMAIELCKALSKHPDGTLRKWSWKMLPLLMKQQPADGPQTEFVTLPHNESDHTVLQIAKKQKTAVDSPGQQRILELGLEALATEQYEQSVRHLEDYLKQKKQFDPTQPQTHIALARAYQGNRQRPEAIGLCQHLIKVGDSGTRAWAQRFMEAIQKYPRTRDPLAAERREQEKTAEPTWDISTTVMVVGLHASIYLGLMLSPLVPKILWRDLGLALIQEGTVSAPLLLPLAIALAPATLPLALYWYAEDKTVRSHAREVVNYWITTFVIALIISALGPMLIMLKEAMATIPLLFNLSRGLMLLAGLSYGLGPALAIVWWFFRSQKQFRYPLIFRLF